LSSFTGAGGSIESIRRRNWIAIAIATLLMMVSYFTYAAAFVDEGGDTDAVDGSLAFIGLAIAPFVFVALGFISRNVNAPKRVLQAMGLLIAVGLAIGLIDPLLGAATGFCVGGALVLNRPDVERLMIWRMSAVMFTALYMLVLLLLAPPAGVFTGGLLPLMMIGFADEYAAWSATRDAQPRH
jgi:hypothetical protein